MEKLSFDVKWLVFPRLYSGGKFSFDKGSAPYQTIKMLYDWRNFLVHYKPRFRDADTDKWERMFNSLNHEEVAIYYRGAVSSIKLLCKELSIPDEIALVYPDEITG